MTFTEHLAELRRRIIVSIVFVCVSCVVGMIFSQSLFELIRRPMSALEASGHIVDDRRPATPPPEATGQPPAAEAPTAGTHWTALTPLEPIWVLIQIGIYAGLFISLPVIIYEICAFVFPGLKPSERRMVNFLVFGCGFLALAGLCLAYFQILPTFMPLIMQYAPIGVDVQWRMSETVSLIIKFLLAFAIAFQFPMVVFVLVYLELLSPATLRSHRRIAIVVLCIAGAALTPGPDPFSMLMMSSALYILYEGSIWVSYFIVWRKRRPVEVQP